MTPLLAALKPICTAQMFNDLAHLPPSLELVEIEYARIGVDEVRRRRSNFADVKPDFFKHLAQNQIQALTAMGLNANALARMADGRTPENIDGQQLNASVDHMLSLNFGGSNDFENLSLVPTRFNALKDKLENLQFQGVAIGTLITIMPRGRTQVPLIEGGFTRARLYA
ncbi:MAG: hypothetical protein KGQ41_08825 [Alphaproteobacteria bacterium]|nr:hypothetical protein [Alphaproteobacteria bacterium]